MAKLEIGVLFTEKSDQTLIPACMEHDDDADILINRSTGIAFNHESLAQVDTLKQMIAQAVIDWRKQLPNRQ